MKALMRKVMMLKVLILVTKLAGLLRKVLMTKLLMLKMLILVTKLAGLLRKVLMLKVLILKTKLAGLLRKLAELWRKLWLQLLEAEIWIDDKVGWLQLVLLI